MKTKMKKKMKKIMKKKKKMKMKMKKKMKNKKMAKQRLDNDKNIEELTNETRTFDLKNLDEIITFKSDNIGNITFENNVFNFFLFEFHLLFYCHYLF